ncbi:MAG: RtcB family protein [Desulfurococcales archaeon]|nr:RtcB family protein [Desulfurococcales archaeon]
MIPKEYQACMKVPSIIYADDFLIDKMKQDLTLKQAANIACLKGIQKYSLVMPDGHQGYGFPIGGVAAMSIDEDGVISPGGVGYDVNCLHPSTNILTHYGFKVSVQQLVKWAKEDRVKRFMLRIFNDKEGHNDFSKINLLASRHSDEFLYKIQTKWGRELIVSDDHPILTPEGYKKAAEIKENDKIIIYPFEGIDYEEGDNKIILNEEDFKGENSQVIKFLKNKGLIPLYSNDIGLGILARFFGYLLGDGTVYRYTESYKGKKRERYIITVYGGEKSLLELKKDLEENLGIKISKVYSRSRKITIKGKVITGTEYSLRINSKAFALLILKLGFPLGEKQNIAFRIPEWIKRGPLWVKRNFLAGLFGADGSKPTQLSKKHPYSLNVINYTISKNKKLEENAIEFLKDIKNMLQEFGVASSIRKVEKSTENNWIYRLVISSNTKYLHNFLSRIGYEYAENKEEILYYTEYVRRKLKLVGQYKDSGLSKVELNRIIAKELGAFEEFVEKYGVPGGFIIDIVEKIEKIPSDTEEVYDIGVYHESHNFIANDVVVHNCGVRVMVTNLDVGDVRPRLRELVDELFRNVPSGLGSAGKVRVSLQELDRVLDEGVGWAISMGYGWSDDPLHIEEHGSWGLADSSMVSRRAKQRGAEQLGTLGSGNHFLEVQVVDKIYDERIAKAFGFTHEGQVSVMVHTGSRGLGHQVASDYLQAMEKAMRKYGTVPPDRELASVPYSSREARDYIRAMAAAANFAWTNRQLITYWTRESFGKVFHTDPDKLGLKLVYDVAHNIAKIEEHVVDGKRMKLIVHRKGATRAFPPGHPEIPQDYKDVGQPVLIPGSMGTASYILAGSTEGAKSWYTAPHGAGRWMSRKKALRTMTVGEVLDELSKQGIYIRAANKRVIVEEAPEAYKNVDKVAETANAAGIGKLVVRLRPLGVAKG